MIDANTFKRAVKDWIRSNPDGTIENLRDFCEEQIPSSEFTANTWIVEQTLSWYGHILSHRDHVEGSDSAGDDKDELVPTVEPRRASGTVW